MGRPRRAIVPLDAEVTGTRTEAEAPEATISPEPVPEPSQRTPERQRLADAIATVAALETELVSAGAALREAEEARTAAFLAHSDAEVVLRHARPREAETFTSGHISPGAIWNGTYNTEEEATQAARLAESPPVSIADAKAAVDAAHDAWDSARRMVQHHGDRLKHASDRLNAKRYDITGAVRAVLRADPAVLALAMECRSLKTRSEAARQAFSLATGGVTIQPGSPLYGWDNVADARTSPEAMEDWSVSRAWRSALETLVSDPDAPLPAL